MDSLRIAVIGGGAAGCFCAIGAKRRLPEADVTLFEAGPKLLAKVAVTGGGRCNLTNSFRDIALTGQEPGKMRLAEVYPRGEQVMRRALRVLSPADTHWPRTCSCWPRRSWRSCGKVPSPRAG